jgi:hypothetical protein
MEPASGEAEPPVPPAADAAAPPLEVVPPDPDRTRELDVELPHPALPIGQKRALTIATKPRLRRYMRAPRKGTRTLASRDPMRAPPDVGCISAPRLSERIRAAPVRALLT